MELHFFRILTHYDQWRNGYPKSVFGVHGISRKIGLKGKLNKAFLHFFVKFLPYLPIFQSSIVYLACSTQKNNQICQKIGKKIKKTLVQFSFKSPFLHGTMGNRIPRFQVPIPSLVIIPSTKSMTHIFISAFAICTVIS